MNAGLGEVKSQDLAADSDDESADAMLAELSKELDLDQPETTTTTSTTTSKTSAQTQTATRATSTTTTSKSTSSADDALLEAELKGLRTDSLDGAPQPLASPGRTSLEAELAALGIEADIQMNSPPTSPTGQTRKQSATTSGARKDSIDLDEELLSELSAETRKQSVDLP